MNLRPYQEEAVAAIIREFEQGIQNTLILLATGTGKTVVFSMAADAVQKQLAARGRPNKILVLAHREELLNQAAEKFEEWTPHLSCDIEQGERRVTRRALPDVTIASVQSLSQPKRLAQFDHTQFGLVVTDECFPSGTLIDNKPIESLRVGDMVWSYNHETKQQEQKPVVRIFVSRPQALLVVRFKSGRTLTCTPGHPFFTGSSYTPAYALTPGQSLFIKDSTYETERMCRLQKHLYSKVLDPQNGPDLLPAMPYYSTRNTQDESRSPVQQLFFANNTNRATQNAVSENWTSVLFRPMQGGNSTPNIFSHHGKDEPRICLGENEESKSNDKHHCQRKGLQHFTSNSVFSFYQRREREGTYWPSISTTLHSEQRRMDSGIRNKDTQGKEFRIPLTLQNRLSPQGTKNCNRSRWEQPLQLSAPRTGQKKRGLFAGERVDSVTFLEQTSDGKFGGLCADGFVYNIEVEGNHNYYANGILVHNCHHATANSYQTIYKAFPHSLNLFVTATPDRTDGVALGSICQSVAYAYDLRLAIEEGYLVPIYREHILIEGLDFSRINPAGKKDFADEDLEGQFLAETALLQVADTTIRLSRDKGLDRPTIAFCPGVEHAEKLAEALNSIRPASAAAIHGKTASRDQILRRYREGQIRYLANFGVLTEGVDLPTTSLISNCRPTKSRLLYSQIAGRGTRLYPGKTDCLIADFTDASSRHDLISPVDIFDGNLDLQIKERAEQIAKRRKIDALTALKEATEEIGRERQLTLAREIAGKTKFSRMQLDAFTVLGVAPRAGRYLGQEVTQDQLAKLERHHIPVVGLDKGQAEQVIEAIAKRARSGLSTPRQAKLLMNYGFDPNVPFEVANSQIDYLARRKWRITPMDREVIRRMAGSMAA